MALSVSPPGVVFRARRFFSWVALVALVVVAGRGLTRPLFAASDAAFLDSTEAPPPPPLEVTTWFAESAQAEREQALPPVMTDADSYLLLGLDRRTDRQRSSRPDTLLVVVLPHASKRVGLVSVPRDLYIDIPDYGPGRVNEVLLAARRAKKEPLRFATRVIGDTLGLTIRHAFAIDIGGFERLIDRAGGVELRVRCPIVDNFIDPRTKTGRRTLDLKAGLQRLDGPTAMMFMRSRHGRSDLDRARRQQSVVVGLHRTVAGAGLADLAGLIDEAASMVASDATALQTLALARQLAQRPITRIHGKVIGSRETEALRTEDGKSVLVPKRDELRDAVRQLFLSRPAGAASPSARCPSAEAAVRRRYARPRRVEPTAKPTDPDASTASKAALSSVDS